MAQCFTKFNQCASCVWLMHPTSTCAQDHLDLCNFTGGVFLHQLVQSTFVCNMYVCTAAQMWTLARNLPVMIGDLVPKDDSNWECYLLLLDILDICMAPILNEELISYLSLLIQHHHEMYRTVYPDETLLPKHHYMVHYPDWMKR